MSKYNFRPYQQKAIDDMMNYKDSNACLLLATGGGKSIVMRGFVEALLADDPSKTICVSVHVKEILDQLKATMKELPIEFISVQKLTKMDKVFDVWIVDEAVHAMAKSYLKIIEHNCKTHFGFTALPVRGLIPDMSPMKATSDLWKFTLTGLKNDKCFDNFVVSLSTKDCIEQGYLTDYKIIRDKAFHINQVEKRLHDFNEEEINDALTVKECVDYVNHTIGDKKVIIFAHSIKYGEQMAKMLGSKARFVSSKSKKQSREKDVEDFKNNKVQILIGVNIFIEGFDVPSCDACYLFRPTRSISVYFQSIGRVLRKSEGKDLALIYDYTNNLGRLGVEPKDIDLNDTLLLGHLCKETCEVCGNYGATEGDKEVKVKAQTTNLGTEFKRVLRQYYEYLDFIPTSRGKCKIDLKETATELSVDEIFDITDNLLLYDEFNFFRLPCYRNKFGIWSININKQEDGSILQSFSNVLAIEGKCKFGDSGIPHIQSLVLKNYENVRKERNARVY